ncbi:MAG: YggS family pyridoxal phosphate-dependent enzyme, partial [Gammaproteobacteria bacterium]|nr:YggS family pyridoxal phosphate-dependent enzyme [Gammaproteobacteria bacterium]
KTHSAEKIRALINAGQLYIGESYLQEALPKISQLADLTSVRGVQWHFIGPIQSNKTKDIAENFSWVHTIDRNKIAQRLNNQRPENMPVLNVCLQVNIDGEPSKSGITIPELPELAKNVMSLPRLKLRGLMTIPARSQNFEKQRLPFKQLRLAFEELNKNGMGLDTLSMGMSNDMEAAIAEGATIIRIGTALFGTRPPIT